MKGLLIKDFLNLKGQTKVYIIFIVFYGMFSLYTDQYSFFSGIVCILCAILPITALAYDEKAQWDKLALSMPITRSQLVLSKYLLAILISPIGLFIVFLLSLIMKTATLEILAIAGACSLIGLSYLSIILPLIFKFGSENSRIIMVMVGVLPAAIILLAAKLGVPMPEVSPVMLAIIGILATVLIFSGSLMISLRIYGNKEF